MITIQAASFMVFFLAPKIKKYCLAIDENGVIQEHKTFQSLKHRRRLLERSQYFFLVVRRWKDIIYVTIKNRIIIATKMRRCINCKGEIICDGCKKQVNKNKEFDDNLNLLKQEAPNQFGRMLPY